MPEPPFTRKNTGSQSWLNHRSLREDGPSEIIPDPRGASMWFRQRIKDTNVIVCFVHIDDSNGQPQQWFSKYA